VRDEVRRGRASPGRSLASASGLAIPKPAVLEPPIETETDESRSAQAAFTAGLAELVRPGGREAAVEYFLTGVGVPEKIITAMRETARGRQWKRSRTPWSTTAW